VDLFSAQPDKAQSKQTESAGREEDELARVAAEVLRDLVKPGQVSADVANAYWAQVVALFPLGPGVATELPLFAWAAMNGVGSRTDYSTAPDIVVGGRKVRATRVFGEIIPSDDRGIPRKVFSTLFESKAVRYTNALGPEFANGLAARAAKSGHPGANPVDVIDFCRGVDASTAGSAGVRVSVKNGLLAIRSDAHAPREVSVSMPTPTAVSNGGLFSH